MADALSGRSEAGPSLRELFDRYGDRVFGFFHSRGFTDEEAEDLNQETFLRVFQNMGKLKSAAAVEPWVLRIAVNLWKNDIRSRRAAKRDAKVLSLDGPLEVDPERLEREARREAEPSALDEILSAEQAAAFRACVEELPPKMRRCLDMHFYQERKVEEIGILLHIATQTVKSHIHQAKDHLRDCVERRLGGAAG